MHRVEVGTCGWSYKDWSRVFYPADLKPADYLPYYAEHFNVVEIDSTFYGIPALKTVEGWRDKTPDGFGFSLKVFKGITHEKLLANCDAELSAFLRAAAALGDKLRCCLLQFEYLNRKAFADLDAFLARLMPFLRAWPAEIPLAVEIRNPKWVTEQLADALRARNAVWALADSAYMPEPLTVVNTLDAVTGPFAYVRLLGDRREVNRLTGTLDRIVVDRAAQLGRDAEAIYRLHQRVRVLIFVNNHYAGFAHATAKELREALVKAGVGIGLEPR